MKFCPKCGSKLEIEKCICQQCGYDLSSRKNKISEEYAANKLTENEDSLKRDNELIVDSNSVGKKALLSNKRKIKILSIGAIIVLLFGFFMIGNSLSKPSRVVSKFEKAITSNSKEGVAGTLYCEDSRLEINDKNVSPLLNYFKDNPSYLNRVIQDLNKDAIKLGEMKNMTTVNENKPQNVLKLVYVGKKFLFFPSYKISVKAAFVQVQTGLKDVVFSLNDTEIGKSDRDKYVKEFGPFVPGKYKLLANYKGKYGSFSDSKHIDIISNNVKNNSIETNVNVLTKLNYINIKSNYPEAEIFVNGKDTGVKIANAENFEPLSSGTKVYATLTKDGKTLKSNEYVVDQGDSTIYISFDNAENLTKEEAKEECSPNYIKWDNITASSTLAASDQANYDPTNVDDWNNSTAWVEGDKGNGIGSSILLKSSTGKNIKGIEISNGYKKSQEIFEVNNRAKKIKVEFSDGSNVVQELKDGYENNNIISLDKMVTTTFIRITILEVYKGSKYSDTAITGIHAF